jgi:hypothetical protein
LAEGFGEGVKGFLCCGVDAGEGVGNEARDGTDVDDLRREGGVRGRIMGGED